MKRKYNTKNTKTIRSVVVSERPSLDNLDTNTRLIFCRVLLRSIIIKDVNSRYVSDKAKKQ